MVLLADARSETACAGIDASAGKISTVISDNASLETRYRNRNVLLDEGTIAFLLNGQGEHIYSRELT
jgi:hypothetical protein